MISSFLLLVMIGCKFSCILCVPHKVPVLSVHSRAGNSEYLHTEISVNYFVDFVDTSSITICFTFLFKASTFCSMLSFLVHIHTLRQARLKHLKFVGINLRNVMNFLFKIWIIPLKFLIHLLLWAKDMCLFYLLVHYQISILFYCHNSRIFFQKLFYLCLSPFHVSIGFWQSFYLTVLSLSVPLQYLLVSPQVFRLCYKCQLFLYIYNFSTGPSYFVDI